MLAHGARECRRCTVLGRALQRGVSSLTGQIPRPSSQGRRRRSASQCRTFSSSSCYGASNSPACSRSRSRSNIPAYDWRTCTLDEFFDGEARTPVLGCYSWTGSAKGLKGWSSTWSRMGLSSDRADRAARELAACRQGSPTHQFRKHVALRLLCVTANLRN
jgi:hypothetical protein